MPRQLSLPPPISGRRFALSIPETRDWLASLPSNPTPEAARSLSEQLGALNRSRAPLRERLVLTALFRDHAEKLISGLEAQVSGMPIPLQAKPRATARVIDDLLAELAYAYKLAVAEMSERWFRFGVARRLHLPVTRAIQMLARRLVLAHRTYAPPPPMVWADMHRLYGIAQHHHIEKLGLSKPGESSLATYRDALLLHFAEPHKLMSGEFDLTLAFLETEGESAVFIESVPQDPVDGLFLIRTERDSPGTAWSRRHTRNREIQTGDKVLVLNTARLADRALQAAETTTNPAGTLSETSQRKTVLMRKLVRHWTASSSRQYSRLRRQARVDICIGLHGVWHFLRETSAGGTVQTSEWIVNNESPGGFAIMLVSGPVDAIKVGEVLGVRGRDTDRVHICVVRWVLSDSPEHVELGLEELSPNAKPVSIARLATSGGYALGSEPGLLLPEIPALQKPAAILAMPGSLSSSEEFHLGEPEQLVRTTQLVEQTHSLELFQFKRLN